MSKVIIMADSSADLTKEMCETRNVYVMPFAINVNGKEYHDGVDITVEEMFEYVEKTKKLPKTAARSVEDIKEMVKMYRSNGEDVVWISISEKLSANAQNAKTALKELGDDNLYCVDSKALSGGIALLIGKACDMRDEGKSGEEIAKVLREYAEKVQVSFIVENLEYLHKGGRCSGVSAFIAGIFKIRPTIRLVDGVMTVGKKYKVSSYEKIVEKYVEDTLSLHPDYENDCCVITHCYASEEALNIAKETLMSKASFKNIVVTKAGSTISTHCGKGTLGILYLCKIDK